MDARPAPDVTELLLAWRDGDTGAFDRLIPVVASELERLAHRYLRGESRQRTLQTADLVQETYLRLVDASRVDWQNRAHFFAIAARSMRRVLVDAARARQSLKRGGDRRQVELDSNVAITEAPEVNLVALDDALATLAALDERRGRVVELRFFGGLTIEETAAVLDVSPETVMRDWRVAKAWLFRYLGEAGPDGHDPDAAGPGGRR
jgi:RNA polymerase sigma factor (TIGR02999 family)